VNQQLSHCSAELGGRCRAAESSSRKISLVEQYEQQWNCRGAQSAATACCYEMAELGRCHVTVRWIFNVSTANLTNNFLWQVRLSMFHGIQQNGHAHLTHIYLVFV